MRVAETPDRLIDEIGQYLTDPARDRDGRRRVTLEQCQFLDGKSAERIAGFVAEELSGVCRSQPVTHESQQSRAMAQR